MMRTKTSKSGHLYIKTLIYSKEINSIELNNANQFCSIYCLHNEHNFILPINKSFHISSAIHPRILKTKKIFNVQLL